MAGVPQRERLFAYGTLMFADVFAAVCGAARPGRAAVLADHARHRLRGVPYPGLVPAAGARTEGVLYEGIDAALWTRLDSFEGDEYERREVHVTGIDGTRCAAQVYLLTPAARQRLDPAPWDAATFRAHHLATYLAGHD